MKAVTEIKIIAIIGVATSLLVLSLNDWSFVSLIQKSLFWLFVYMLFTTFTGICFAFSFLHRYDFRPFRKWLIPATVVVYTIPALISMCVSQDLRYLAVICFYIAALLLGVGVLAWWQGCKTNKKIS